MKDKSRVFVDTNLLVYQVYGTKEEKKKLVDVLQKISERAIISTQVLKEFTNVSLKKKLCKNSKELKGYINQAIQLFELVDIDPKNIEDAIDINNEYGYSFYDSLIIASAIANNCSILYSEDLQHGQTINKQLKIINPLK